MEYLTSGRQILSHFFPHISSQRDIQNLWNCCPNQMLWEAISAYDANLISDFATEVKTSEKTVIKWINNGYIPGASVENNYVPDSARKPYTKARAKNSDAVYCSIVKACMNFCHVVPALYNMRDDEFNGYIDRLIAAGYISTRVADGVTYYDAAITASDFSKSKLLKDLLPIIKATSEGVATAALKYVDSKLI